MTDASAASPLPRSSDPATRQSGAPVSPSPAPLRSKPIAAKARPADRIFRFLSTASASLIMVILAGVALFLIIKAAPAIGADWTQGDLAKGTTAGHTSFWSYSAPFIWGTVWMSIIGLVMGAPVAIGIALFISHYAPRRFAGALGYIVDLLAAVPSIIFGLWGIFVIRRFLLPFEEWLNAHLDWFPLFSGKVTTTGSTVLAGAVVLAVMVLPIITSISREIFLQTPRLHEEAALALGATKWETVRLAVFPYARSGVISGILLGLGRAMGETMAIALILSPAAVFSVKILTESENSQTIAANIALNFPESDALQRDALIGTGLTLFLISLVVNFAARFIIGRRPGSGGSRRRKKVVPPLDATSALASDDVAASPLAALHEHGSSAHPEGLKPLIPEGREA